LLEHDLGEPLRLAVELRPAVEDAAERVLAEAPA
jgi:hypothetical protein